MSRSVDRRASVEAGALAGIAGLVVFLVLHHAWIAPICFVAPMGAVLATIGGAAVGAAYAELRPRLPGRPWTSACVMALTSAILAPAVAAGELSGPVYAIGSDGRGVLRVPASEAILAFVGGLLVTATLTGGLLGALIGRTRRAAALTATAGFCLALGPGHNIPLLGGTPAVATELAILAAVTGVASVVLVVSEGRLASPSAPEEADLGIREPSRTRAGAPSGWQGPDPRSGPPSGGPSRSPSSGRRR